MSFQNKNTFGHLQNEGGRSQYEHQENQSRLFKNPFVTRLFQEDDHN